MAGWSHLRNTPVAPLPQSDKTRRASYGCKFHGHQNHKLYQKKLKDKNGEGDLIIRLAG